MRILLIKPNSGTDTVVPPIGLGYLASMVRTNNIVKIIDCNKDNIDSGTLLDIVKNFSPDLVGVQVYSTDKMLCYKYLKLIKMYNKNIVTVIGGPCPSCEPDVVDKFFSNLVDFGFCGESEIGFKKFVDRISSNELSDLNDIEGLIWRTNGNIKINNVKFVDNLDELPYTSWDLLRPDEYPPSPVGGFLKMYPVAPIVISRGCPYRCSFCAGFKITGSRVRYRSVDNVIKEIELLKEKFNVKEIHIIDDNFTYDRKYVETFCSKVIEKKLNLKFCCPNGVRLDTLDEKLLLLMKSAGFYSIHIGIESGSNRMLEYMGKKLKVEDIMEKTKLIKQTGLDLCGYFILGHPGETVSDLKKTISLSLKLPLDRAMFMNFLPIPGSPIMSKLSISTNNKFKKKNFYTVNYVSTEISYTKLKFFQMVAFLRFYLRLRILCKNFSRVYNYKHLYFLLKRVINILTHV